LQLACAAGASVVYVTGASSAEKAAVARRESSTEVVSLAYRDADGWLPVVRGKIDLAIDFVCSGDGSYGQSAKALREDGTGLLVAAGDMAYIDSLAEKGDAAANAGDAYQVLAATMRRYFANSGGLTLPNRTVVYDFFDECKINGPRRSQYEEDVQILFGMATEGTINPILTRCVSLEDVPSAHAAIEAGRKGRHSAASGGGHVICLPCAFDVAESAIECLPPDERSAAASSLIESSGRNVPVNMRIHKGIKMVPRGKSSSMPKKKFSMFVSKQEPGKARASSRLRQKSTLAVKSDRRTPPSAKEMGAEKVVVKADKANRGRSPSPKRKGAASAVANRVERAKSPPDRGAPKRRVQKHVRSGRNDRRCWPAFPGCAPKIEPTPIRSDKFNPPRVLRLKTKTPLCTDAFECNSKRSNEVSLVDERGRKYYMTIDDSGLDLIAEDTENTPTEDEPERVKTEVDAEAEKEKEVSAARESSSNKLEGAPSIFSAWDDGIDMVDSFAAHPSLAQLCALVDSSQAGLRELVDKASAAIFEESATFTDGIPTPQTERDPSIVMIPPDDKPASRLSGSEKRAEGGKGDNAPRFRSTKTLTTGNAISLEENYSIEAQPSLEGDDGTATTSESASKLFNPTYALDTNVTEDEGIMETTSLQSERNLRAYGSRYGNSRESGLCRFESGTICNPTEILEKPLTLLRPKVSFAAKDKPKELTEVYENESVRYDTIGGPHVLSVEKCNDYFDYISDDDVVVKVEASTVSQMDCEIRRGIFRRDVSTLPRRTGSDMVGRVIKTGKNVKPSTLNVGDRVCSIGPELSGNSRFVIVDKNRLFPVPPDQDSMYVPCLARTYVMAYQCLHRVGGKTMRLEGERILVIGGCGIIGQAIVQLANAAGARQIFVTGGPQHGSRDEIESRGCVKLEYDSSHWLRKVEGKMDKVIDLVNSHGYIESLTALNEKGRLICAGSGIHEDGHFSSIVDSMLSPVHAYRLVGRAYRYDLFHEFEQNALIYREDLERMFRMARKGVIKPNVEKCIPLRAVPSAHKNIERGVVKGALVCLPFGPEEINTHMRQESARPIRTAGTSNGASSLPSYRGQETRATQQPAGAAAHTRSRRRKGDSLRRVGRRNSRD